jgi:beta-ureidopropionase / N-carbamoyl-L-amino-acid hydrolase
MRRFEPNLDRIRRDIFKLSEFTTPDEPGYTRISFTKEDKEAREYVVRLMTEEAGLKVRTDAAGNVIGRREGKKAAPSVLIGSHVDTVRGGGRFDGVSGVVAAVELMRRFKELNIENIHPVEVVIFLAEEPSPFGISTVGSRAMAGKLMDEQLSTLRDETGRTLADAIAEMGGDPDHIDKARRSPDDMLAYLELHIEQGPHLHAQALQIGAVTGIVGIWRANIEVVGRNDHAGTTPMGLRKDALVAASEVILALEKICTDADGVVGTIGRVDVFPNALNVIPGRVTLGMEVRSLHDHFVERVTTSFEAEIANIIEKRGVSIAFELWKSSKAVIFPSTMVKRIGNSCALLGLAYADVPSQAGHDANHLAEIVPTGMIFVPSRDGRSHCPEEWTDFEDIVRGTEVLGQAIYEIDFHG